MKKILLTCFMLVFVLYAWAQDRTVSGTVSDAETGETLPGVNVLLKGTGTGVNTDLDGNYKISVPSDGGTLVFSFIGMQKIEVKVGNRSVVDVAMESDVKQLSEVVVTAGGLEREAKGLGYSVEEVQGDAIQQVAEPDPLRALQGKVAGVNISGSGGAAGSATRITIRGNSSLLGDNQPLFVVDGIPYNNNTNGTFNQLGSGGAYGSRISDIDPNNIESMTVLKGGAAAALYGTRASNGVVLITTKTGSARAGKKGLQVAVNSSIAFEEIANLPDYQNTYGAGTNYNYQQVNGSWGAPFIGTRNYANTPSIPHWYAGRDGWGGLYDDVTVPYQAYPDNAEKLFKTGVLLDNSITISGGNENSVLTTTISRSDNTGYVPNTLFNKTNVSVGGRSELDNGFNFGANLNYTKTVQEGVQSGVGLSGSNNPSAFARALYMGRNWDVHGQPYQNPTDLGSEFMVGRGQADNPLWSYENAGFTVDVNRIVAAADMSYDITDYLNVSYKAGINTYTQKNTDFIRPGSTGPASNPGEGRYLFDLIQYEEIESNFIVTFNKNLNDDFHLRALVGHNFNQRTSEGQAVQGIGYVAFDIDDLDNTNNVTPFGRGYSQRRIIGAYTDVLLDFRDYLFLGLTARNDWSSTLPQANRSFFYPGAALSAVLTDALDIETSTLNFLKIRAAASRVGSDTDPYLINRVFLINPSADTPFTPSGGSATPTTSLSNQERDANLKPEQKTEYELGFESRLFNNRVGLDVTVYRNETTNQIVPINLPASSGATSFLTNFGVVSNQGLEVTLNLTPVELNNGFSWNILGTFTHNKNVIEELREGVDEITFGAGFAGGVIATHRAGQEYGLIRGAVNARDDEGNLLIDPANGQLIPALDPAIIGNPNPDFKVGITNTFSFKGFSLSGVFDWTQGGDVWSNTVLSLLGRGVTTDTEDRETPKIIPGVYGDPNTLEPIRTEETGEKIPNSTMIDENSLWFGNSFAINGADEWAVWDATVYRLREASLSYALPKSILDSTPFGSVRISVIGRNLLYWAPNFPPGSNFDPEVNQFGASNQQGFEFSATPTTRRVAVALRFTF